MKYLLKFNEAYAEYQITDRDTEIIENCFLEYIDKNECTEAFAKEQYVVIETQPPVLSQDPTERVENVLAQAACLKELMTRMSGDIERCESYGYELMFCFLIDPFSQFSNDTDSITSCNIWIAHKGFWGSRSRAIQALSSGIKKILNYQDSLDYLEKIIEASKKL